MTVPVGGGTDHPHPVAWRFYIAQAHSWAWAEDAASADRLAAEGWKIEALVPLSALVEADQRTQAAREALRAMQDWLATSSRDWSVQEVDALLYAVLLGWDDDDPDDPDEVSADDVYVEFVERWHWTAEHVGRLRGWHAAVRALGDPS